MIFVDLDNHRLELPVFNDPQGLEVRWQTYQILTAVVHFRPSRQAGQHRVVAFLPDVPGLWYSDDNQPAQKLTRLLPEIEEQCYVRGCLIR